MDWRFSLFIVGLIAFLAFWTWAPDSPMCQLEFVRQTIATASKDGAANCFEFWINRYQTAIAAMLALATAMIALRPARAQLREMVRQTNQKDYEDYRARYISLMEFRGFMVTLVAAMQLTYSKLLYFFKSDIDTNEPGERVRGVIQSLENTTGIINSLPGPLAAPWGGKVVFDAKNGSIDACFDFGIKIDPVYVKIKDWVARGCPTDENWDVNTGIRGEYEHARMAMERFKFNAMKILHCLVDEQQRIEKEIARLGALGQKDNN